MDVTPRPCETRPEDWWEFGDDGNRLAVLLCATCPGCLFVTAGQPRGVVTHWNPRGVIVDGVPYDDHGRRHALCPCGYPSVNPADRHRNSTKSQPCKRCKLPDISLWRDYIERRRRAGDTLPAIARTVPFTLEHIRLNAAKWAAQSALEAQPA